MASYPTRFRQLAARNRLSILMSRQISLSSSPSTVLAIEPLSLTAEATQFTDRSAKMSAFFSHPRFSSLRRPYTPSDVVLKQGSLPVIPLPSTLLADKLYAILSRA